MRFGKHDFFQLACLATLALNVVFGESAAAGQFTSLHSFAGEPNDGGSPNSALTPGGSKLYGTTARGGADDGGTVYSMNSDGSGFQLLHSFAADSGGGLFPFGGLTLSGSTLFGTTWNGGPAAAGTIYSMNTDGSNFQVLHTFAGGANDGGMPAGALILSGSTLLGVTQMGGLNNDGTVFSMNVNGNGFQLMHSFGSSALDGLSPLAGMTLSGSTLFGTTNSGGSKDTGTVFSLNTDGTGFQVLHSFGSIAGEGTRPESGLTLSGSTLFGTTPFGGADGFGTVFSMNTDGTGVQLLHSFAIAASDGALPETDLRVSGSTLFGTTPLGGANGGGTVYSMNSDGSAFQLLHSFAASPGNPPVLDLTLNGSTLIGATASGGTNTMGMVFAISIPEPSSLVLASVGLAMLLGFAGRRQALRDRSFSPTP
jgi:uncharacterized repeat protein (TIGR03803 family)